MKRRLERKVCWLDTSGGVASRKKELDEALVDMVVKDCQPFTVVNDQGFKGLVKLLDPSYVLPTRQALKAMVEERYQKAKREAKALVQQATAVSLTADMWTSMNMEAYLAVTCHFIADGVLNTTLLGVEHFPKSHTALNMARAKGAIMEEWGIRHKVTCLVTDAASNMLACGRELHLKQAVCVAHAINLMVKKSMDETPGLENLRSSARRIVTLFRSSTTAKERLSQMQERMGRPLHKLLQEVETRWNSTYIMLERLHSEREAVSAAMASLPSEVAMITAMEFSIIQECLGVLRPFNEATVELSAEKRVSASKILPLLKMVSLNLGEQLAHIHTDMAKHLTKNLQLRLMESLSHYQKTSILTLPTLLDPRFKTLGFLSPSKIEDAIKRLTTECGLVIGQGNVGLQSPHLSTPAAVHEDEEPSTSSGGLWRHLDATVQRTRQTHNTTADAIVEVQRYLKEPHINRSDDPLQYWNTHKPLYPHLYILSLKFLCTPAFSVPCERIFSKAGEVVSKKRNRLSPKVLEQILFLNKNT
ncbi:Zinc finger BED domain-containing protein 1 [Merluccius polli]|uniref:Zinc finger BED domain-containing protein 1 n=1 Tax=Merluccius polli TaxID=89951 RepID=A0AA47N3V3_MERPO|nr:Zinc finger BED domain-containing protein 1 [Merluccius polli]